MKSSFFLCIFLIAAFAGVSYGEERNLFVVLDTSGSMTASTYSDQAPKIDSVKGALLEVLPLLEDANIGLVSRSSWLYELGKYDQTKLENSLKSISCYGDMPTYACLHEIYKKLITLDLVSKEIVIIVDGKSSDESSDFGVDKPIIKALVDMGVSIHMIAYNYPSKDPLMGRINGKYYNVGDSQTLISALEDITKFRQRVLLVENFDESFYSWPVWERQKQLTAEEESLVKMALKSQSSFDEPRTETDLGFITLMFVIVMFLVFLFIMFLSSI